MNSHHLFRYSKYIGATGALVSCSLWLVLFFINPYVISGTESIENPITAPGVLMAAFSLVAVWASIKGRLFLLFAVSAISLLPMGIYLLGSPGIFKWIGVMNIVCLLSAISMFAIRRVSLPTFKRSSK